jgi:hypothetical protein
MVEALLISLFIGSMLTVGLAARPQPQPVPARNRQRR